MNQTVKQQVLSLITKSVDTHDATDALKLTQAALNAANALAVLDQLDRGTIRKDDEREQ